MPELMEQILHLPPLSPTSLNPRVPRRLQSMCLEKNPAKRYQSTKELLDDLAPLAAPAVRSRGWWGATVAVAITGLPAVAGLVWTRGPARHASRSEWVQITNLPDAVTQPALSPDGRLLAFVRGPGTFITPGQIYVKSLPDSTRLAWHPLS